MLDKAGIRPACGAYQNVTRTPVSGSRRTHEKKRDSRAAERKFPSDSSYAEDYLYSFAQRLAFEAKNVEVIWCIFDNTTLGAATRNALDVQQLLALDQ